jgi:hypothetical protein
VVLQLVCLTVDDNCCAATVFKALCALLEQDMVDSEYLDLIPYEEVEHPVRRRSSILGFGGSGISSNNLTSGVITGVCVCVCV